MSGLPEAMLRELGMYQLVESDGLRLPLFLMPASAGTPMPTEDYLDKRLDLLKHLVRRPQDTFLVRASGDSMTGVGIFDGDLLIVDRSLEPRDGDVVVASVDNQPTIKTFRCLYNRRWLQPENSAHENIELRGVDYHCWGVTVHSVRTHRRIA
jgi:DNA polymerase V